MEKISNSIGDLLRLAVAMSGNHEDPSKELSKIKEGKIYSKYLDENWWDKAARRAIDTSKKREESGEEADVIADIKAPFDIINPIEKEYREHLIYDITGVIFADGELTETEELFWGLVRENIDLTEEEILAQQQIYNEDLKKKVEKLKAKNEFMYAFAYPYWLIVAADGEVDDGEIDALNNESKMLKKYSGPAAIMSCEDNFKPELKWDMENDEKEIGLEKYNNRLKASINMINERLPKKDLKEVIYELNKIIWSDDDMHENEKFLFGLICEHINLTQEELNEVINKVTEELKVRFGLDSEEPTEKVAPKEKTKPKVKKPTSSSSTETAPSEGIYRSSDDKVMIGLCAGLADKFNIKKELVRGVVVIGAIVSSGALIIPYLCGILLKEESTI